MSIGIDAPELPTASRHAFEAAGLTVDVAIVLTATALAPPREPAIAAELRPLTSDDDWEARARLSHELDPAVPTEAFLAYAHRKNEQERRLVADGRGIRLGAFVDGRLVSTAAVFGTGDNLARFQSVETQADFRRQGIAGAVVHAAGQYALTDLGVTTLVMVAEAEGEALGLYRRLGFADAERHLTLEKRSGEWAGA